MHKHIAAIKKAVHMMEKAHAKEGKLHKAEGKAMSKVEHHAKAHHAKAHHAKAHHVKAHHSKEHKEHHAKAHHEKHHAKHHAKAHHAKRHAMATKGTDNEASPRGTSNAAKKFHMEMY